MEKNHLDHNKFELLVALADTNPSIPEFLARLDQLRELTADTVKDAKTGIILTTAHSSKGLEYDTVYLMDVYDGQFPGSNATEVLGRKHNMDLIQEERRLFYVAMTRAKNHLNIFAIKGRPASFVDEILPPPEPPKSATPTKPRYSIDQFRLEQEKRERERAEINRKMAENLRKREEERQKAAEVAKKEAAAAVQAALEKAYADRYKQGYAQVKNQSFQSESIVEDSFGIRWLQCERCGEIKCKDDFSLIGRRNRPSVGICSECARKTN
jgi:ATP-dependent exoDNAse (exonuclease V) beta subunit